MPLLLSGAQDRAGCDQLCPRIVLYGERYPGGDGSDRFLPPSYEDDVWSWKFPGKCLDPKDPAGICAQAVPCPGGHSHRRGEGGQRAGQPGLEDLEGSGGRQPPAPEAVPGAGRSCHFWRGLRTGWGYCLQRGSRTGRGCRLRRGSRTGWGCRPQRGPWTGWGCRLQRGWPTGLWRHLLCLQPVWGGLWAHPGDLSLSDADGTGFFGPVKRLQGLLPAPFCRYHEGVYGAGFRQGAAKGGPGFIPDDGGKPGEDPGGYRLVHR